jgi:glycosyltransferase involved in cell wall biosynthesis
MIRKRPKALAVAAARAATSERIVGNATGARAWRWALAAPGVPDRVRGMFALRVTRMLVATGRLDEAVATATAAARRVHTPYLRARLLGASIDPDHTRCDLPPAVRDWWATQLADADARLAAGDIGASADRVAAAMMLAFNRGLHFDRLCSPLARDPAGFLEPLRRSRAVQAIHGAVRRQPPRSPGRPTRLLIVYYQNDNFLRDIRDRYQGHGDAEIRYLDLASDPALKPWLVGGRMPHMAKELLAGGTQMGREVERVLRPHLDWADTMFVEWCAAGAVAATMVDPGHCRVIVRLHSYEAFTAWPHLVNFGRVDDVVFVSEPLRAFVRAALPAVADADGPRLSVIPNVIDLDRFAQSKPDDARFTLGLIGIGTVAKDPRWAIAVLRRLRERDSRYRLLLVGEDMDATLTGPVRQYYDLLATDLAELEPIGAVRRVGQTNDTPGALVDVGVILSTSVRESFHLGLVEGAASGAIPVVRNWPFFAAFGGPRLLFPADWVVDTPEEAADRILSLTDSDERWRSAGQAASAHAFATWQRSTTLEAFDRLLLGEATTKGAQR